VGGGGGLNRANETAGGEIKMNGELGSAQPQQHVANAGAGYGMQQQQQQQNVLSAPPPSEIHIGNNPAATVLSHDEYTDCASIDNYKPPKPAPVTTTVAASAANYSSKASYNTGDETTELAKLKAVLQQLQAENISLKAQLGDYSEEELQVKKELQETVLEIGTLSKELTYLRANVVSAKATLIESTSELKAQMEKKELMSDLIGDTQGTLEAINNAQEGINEIKQRADAVEAQQNAKVEAANNFGSNLFGLDGEQSQQQQQMHHQQQEQMHMQQQQMQQNQIQQPQQLQHDLNQESQPPTSTNPFIAPHTASVTSEQEAVPPQTASEPPAVPAPAPGDDLLGMAPPVPPSALPPGPTPVSFDAVPMGGKMPSTSTPNAVFSQENTMPPQYHSASTTAQGAGNGPVSLEVERMRNEVNQLTESAREADSMSNAVTLRVEELRSYAEQAELEAVKLKTAAESKGKGVFGRGSKKQMKELEKAMQNAATAKNSLLEAQTQAQTFQAQAASARTEADAKRRELEQAEIAAAAEASMIEAEEARKRAEEAWRREDEEKKLAEQNAKQVGAPAPAPAGELPPSHVGGNVGMGSNMVAGVNGLPGGGMMGFGNATGTLPSNGSVSNEQNVFASGGMNGMPANNMIGWGGFQAGGAMGGAKSVESGGGGVMSGIPSPGNSVHGDDDSNPFGGF